MGEYKLNNAKISKVASISSNHNQSLELPKKPKVSLVENKDNTSTYTTEYETYDAPPSSKKMKSLYGHGFQILYKNCNYVGNGCGVNQQGIKVPLEAVAYNSSTGIGYRSLKPTKAYHHPTLNINSISTSSRLNMTYPEMIYMDVR